MSASASCGLMLQHSRHPPHSAKDPGSEIQQAPRCPKETAAPGEGGQRVRDGGEDADNIRLLEVLLSHLGTAWCIGVDLTPMLLISICSVCFCLFFIKNLMDI